MEIVAESWEKLLHKLKQDFVYEECNKHLPNLLTLAGNDIVAKVRILTEVAFWYSCMGKYEGAADLLIKAKIESENGDNLAKAWYCFALARAHFNEPEFFQYIDDSKKIISENNNRLLEQLIVLEEIWQSLRDGKYKKALEQARIINNSPENAVISADSEMALGLIYYEMNLYEVCEIHSRNALKQFIELGYKKGIAGAYSNIAICYTAMERYQNAIAYCKEALKVIEQTSSIDFYLTILSNLGLSYRKINDYENALHYLKLGLDIAMNYRDKDRVVFAMQLGYVYFDIRNLTESLNNFEMAISYIEVLDFDNRIYLLKGLVNTCRELGLVEKTVAYLTNLYELNTNFYNSKLEATISHQLYLEQQSRIQEKMISNLKIEQAEEKFNLQTIHLATQTELLGNFRNKLRAIVREIDEPIVALKRIKEELKTLPCESVDWQKFEQQFISVHPEFKAKLEEKYPVLTKQEVKMCQLARLGLKVHEMATLLCLSERSIESHRYNLRKKIGIKTEENLQKFLETMFL